MYEKKRKSSAYRILAEIICLALGVGSGALGVFWALRQPQDWLLIDITLAVCVVALGTFALLGFSVIERKRLVRLPSGPVLGSIMYDVINTAPEPALICDENKKIIWFNRYAQVVSGQTGSLLGTRLSVLMPNPLPDEGDKERELITVLGDNTYSVDVTKIRSDGKIYNLLLFRNITKQARLEQYVKDEEKAIAYVIVDNLDELTQFEQENYREAAAKIETTLRDWVADVDGMIKEYEKDKYLILFKNENLDRFVNEKFSIIDKIRNLNVSGTSIPLTISMGVSKVQGSLADKEKAAHIALDMALQRGGDQVVVKYDDNTLFFGGKTSTIHKRTKVRARVAAHRLAGYMASASNVIIMGHKFPDYDAFGASVGIARLAMFCGVKVNIVTDPKNPNIKRCLKHFESFDAEYKGLFVDASRGMDLIKSETLLVIVDVNNPDMFESIDIYNNVYNTVIVDHHRKTAESERPLLIEYIDPASSSASELVSEMLEQALPPQTLERVEANMLLAGISLDTKQFTKGAGTKTYAAAVYLLGNNASYEDIQDLFKTSIVDYRQISKFGQKVEIYRNSMAIAVNFEVGDKNADRTLAAQVADNLLMVENVSASFALMQIEDTIHISARSNGTVNVQLILEQLKGGGRYDSAGAQLKSASIQQALMKLKDAIDSQINAEG
ncbi:MAG: DHH family phosphoesterase [Clostridia bacterium]|nr:DHH family phosphoesterase [Clostridia bacterium]